jgi:hypothetical protein
MRERCRNHTHQHEPPDPSRVSQRVPERPQAASRVANQRDDIQFEGVEQAIQPCDRVSRNRHRGRSTGSLSPIPGRAGANTRTPSSAFMNGNRKPAPAAEPWRSTIGGSLTLGNSIYVVRRASSSSRPRCLQRPPLAILDPQERVGFLVVGEPQVLAVPFQPLVFHPDGQDPEQHHLRERAAVLEG